MTHTELRKSAAAVTAKLKEYNKKYEVTMESDKHGIRMMLWEKKNGNRQPVAKAVRMCIGDVLNEIDKQIRS